MKIKKFKDWKLLTKIMSISIATMALMLSTTLFYIIPEVAKYIEAEKKSSTQNVVDIAFTLMAEYDNRVKAGDLSLKEAQEKASARLRGLRYQEKDYFWINDLGPTMVMHPFKPQLEGKNLSEVKDPNGKPLFLEFVDVCKQNGEGFVDYMWPKPGASEPVPKISYVKLYRPWGWIVGSGIYVDDMQKQIAKLRWTVVIVVFLCTVAALGLSFIIARKISGPVSKGVDFAEKVAGGDLTGIFDIDQKDEIGILARALNKTVSNLGEIFKGIAANVETLTSSSSQLGSISQQMSSGAKQTAGRSNSVSVAAEEMSSNMNSVAAAVEEASTNVSMVAAATEEMTATINEIAQNSEKAHVVTDEAVSEADGVFEKVRELGAAAQEIGKVTETITEISEQTNLLALNATIEAARAGEAGKGFAVVANEIKDLAKQTASATLDIKTKIEGIQSSTGGTITSIEEISKIITEVNKIVSGIAGAVEEQSATTKEIANNVAQASQGIQEVTENVAQSSSVAAEIAKDISEVNQSANEMSNSSSQVNLSAGELGKLSEQLREIVAKFKV
ncbi:MAG: methyl-accepting chemotaxis protein [Thermodesulfobacteriota bacterium]|nr:methyl-accepting chemotaxis protein [Thermodesulfobacteriota bacterium]